MGIEVTGLSKKEKTEKKSNKKIKSAGALQTQETVRSAKKCPQCGIILLQGGDTCPFCHCVPEDQDEAASAQIKKDFGSGAPYPDIMRKQRLVRFALRLILFIMIVITATSVALNFAFTPTIWWSLIVMAGMIYGYVMLDYWIKHDAGFANKIGVQIFVSILFIFLADYLTGNRGWALQWVIPSIILFGDAVVFFLMLLNRSRWTSYLLLLILMELAGATILFLLFAGYIQNGILVIICIAVTSVFLLATVIFGDAKITTELKRRFHV